MPLTFVLSGASGVGKSTLLDHVSAIPDLRHVQTFTTRPKRREESRGRSDYLHVSISEFDQLVTEGKILFPIERYGHRYGMPESVFSDLDPQCQIVSLDPRGYEELKRRSSRRVVGVFVGVQAPSDLLERVPDARGRHLARDFADYLDASQIYDWHLINDDSRQTAQDLARIIAAESREFEVQSRLGGRLIARSDQHSGSIYAIVVKAVVVRHGMILLMRSSSASHGTQVDLPGGRLVHGEDIVDCLGREVFEETSLRVSPIGPVRTWTFISTSGVQYIGITYACRWVDGEVSLSPEHSSFVWLSRETIPEDLPERDELLAALELADSGMPRVSGHSRPTRR